MSQLEVAVQDRLELLFAGETTLLDPAGKNFSNMDRENRDGPRIRSFDNDHY